MVSFLIIIIYNCGVNDCGVLIRLIIESEALPRSTLPLQLPVASGQDQIRIDSIRGLIKAGSAGENIIMLLLVFFIINNIKTFTYT